MEKDIDEKLDKSTKFNMALQVLLDEKEFTDDEEV